MIATLFSTYVALAACASMEDAKKLMAAAFSRTQPVVVQCKPLGMVTVEPDVIAQLKKEDYTMSDNMGRVIGTYSNAHGVIFVIYIPNTEA